MKNNKTAKKGSYKETKSAPNLEETVINDPYGILAGMFGRKYEEYRKRWKETGERKYVTGFPVHVDVDLSDSCNLSCRYCLQCTKQGWSNKYMSMPAFKKIVKESDEEKLCSMNIGWNTEPLMDVSLFKKALDVIDKSGIIDVFIHTNAVNLSEDVQKRMIQSKINTVCFSLGEFNDETRENVREKIKSNIISFRRMRDSMKKRTPIIRISLLPSENNMKEVKEYREFWKDYADYIEFQAVNSPEKKDEKIYAKQSFKCSDPWRRLSITSSGDIYPCCAFTYFSKDLVLGNIDKMSLKQAWNSDKMNELRKQLESGKNMSAGCARCLNGVYMIKMKD